MNQTNENDPLRRPTSDQFDQRSDERDSGDRGGNRLVVLTLLGTVVPLLILLLAMVSIIHVPWDQPLLPVVVFFVGIAYSIGTLTMAVRYRVSHRDRRGTASIVLSIFNLLWVVAIAWMLAMIALAGHPV